MSSSETAEKGRGVVIGYLKPAAARASARFDADFLKTDETAVIEDEAREIALGVDANRLRIILLQREVEDRGSEREQRKKNTNCVFVCFYVRRFGARASSRLFKAKKTPLSPPNKISRYEIRCYFGP